MAIETGLTATVPKRFYKKPFVRRMLDPSTPTIEIDGEEASGKTMSMDGKLFPTVVPQEQADGSYGLVQLKPEAAYDLAVKTGNFIQFDSDEQADRNSKVLSEEASALRKAYRDNQNFLAQGGRGLGDIEFRADVEPYVGDDALTRLGLELYRRGEIELKGITQDQTERFARGSNTVMGGYAGRGFSRLSDVLERNLRDQNPLTKEKIMSNPSLATYVAGVSEESDTTYDRPRGDSELSALHELRHGAMRYLFNNTDLEKQKYFDNYDIDVEEDIMDMIDNKVIKDQQMSMEVDKVSKTNPKYIGRKDRLKTVTDYATNALKDFNVPERVEQRKPSMLQRLFGKEQGGIMMAQQGQAALPMTEATSPPQGGGPKSANPAGQPSLIKPAQTAPRPGSQDPRDAAIQELSQKMSQDNPPPANLAQVGGLAAPVQQQQPTMMAKGGTKEDSSEGLAVMIGLGAPTPSYESAAEGNPPPGATKEEVADDQLVLLSEGELVVPANVVRYHGLGTYEGMRREALMGLQDMEQSGQIEYVSGGNKKADKIDDNGGIVKANQGLMLGTGVPVAASSRFVTTPANQTQTSAGLLPAVTTTQPLTGLGYTPNIDPTKITGVYAPNVGSFQKSIDSSPGSDTDSDTGTGTGETEEERRRRLAAQNAGEGGDSGEEPYLGATTVFGGTSQDGLIRGGKQYQIAYESSAAKPGTGMLGALSNIANLDQVRITDPDTGKSVNMSRETYNKMTENRTDPNNINFINDLLARQDAINYNRDRASKIAPFQTGLAVAGESIFGLGNAPGLSVAEQNETARSLANNLGIEYTGQSMAEMLALEQISATKTSQGLPKSTVLREDAQGNLVPDTRFNQGLAVPETAFGAGQFSGAPAQPVAVSSFAGPFTQPTLGLAAPTTEAGRLAQFETPTRDTRAVAMSMPNQIGVGPRDTGDVARQTDDIFSTPAMDSGMSIPDELSGARMSSVNDPGRRGGERRGERAAYQASLFEDDFETPDNQQFDDDDAPEASFDMSTRSGRAAAADNEAQEQTGNPNATAVKDSDGNPVTSTNPDGTKSIVTNPPPQDDGGSPDKSIVCTEMYRQTQLDDWAKAMKIWHIYQKKYLTPLHEVGYHWLFKPYVHGMRTSNLLTTLGAFFAQKRTQHLKHVLTKGKSEDSLIGNVWCKIIHPIVYMVGKMVYKK